ncbi:MAG: hypothetical protein ABL962_03100 [Fimbriimonadaceae bacterium]
MKNLTFLMTAMATLAITPGFTQGGQRPDREFDQYMNAIQNTANMVNDPAATRLAQQHGLNILNVTWEDTGRYKGSSVGPNISDLTIQVVAKSRGRNGVVTRAMPVIRHPNFSDLTADIDPLSFTLLVGNQAQRNLRRVSLAELLASPTRYMSTPNSWAGRQPKTLLAHSDTKVLVSAQACFLPIPKEGKATFNPVLFNYQSGPNNPAVMTILATREGTSMTIIDNQRDSAGFGWGQRLFHNQGGDRASLTGQRISDFINDGRPSQGGVRVADSALNMVMVIQVPLKHREMGRGGTGFGAPATAGAAEMKDLAKSKRMSDTEAAVIGHGEFEGPFTEFANLPIERDTRFPVRVTVQFYKATSTGVASAADIRQIKQEIDNIYKHSDSVGSLVTGGRTGRVTEYEGSKVQPANWWSGFWRDYESRTGESRTAAISKLRTVLGQDYMDEPVCGLYLRDTLRNGATNPSNLLRKSGIGF